MAADPEVRPVATERDALLAPKHDDDPETAQDETLDEEELDEPKIPGVKIQYILPALALGIFLAAMDNTIVVSSYGAIGNDLKELNRTSWIATAYLLTTTSFQPLYGKLSDIFGRKASLLFAYAVFGIGCLACGMSMSLEQLVAARAFAGIGGGGMTTVVSILVSDIVGLRSRGTWQGVLNIVFASGAAAGAPLGGIIADTIGWRWAFILHSGNTPRNSNSQHLPQLPAPELVGNRLQDAAIPRRLPGRRSPRASRAEPSHRPRQSGNLSITSPVVDNLAVDRACPLRYLHVRRIVIAAEPFAPPHVVKQRHDPRLGLANSSPSPRTYGAFFRAALLPSAGMRLLPAIAGGVSGSLAGGLLMQKTGKYYWLTVSSYCGLPVLGSAAVLVLHLCRRRPPPQPQASASASSPPASETASASPPRSWRSSPARGSKDQARGHGRKHTSFSARSGTVSGVSLRPRCWCRPLRTGLERRLGSGDEARKSMDFIATLPDELRAAVRECYRDAVHVAFASRCSWPFAPSSAACLFGEAAGRVSISSG
ncbi:MFS multidrug transporter [Sphaerosporella brunnea]|uniref:MFS multidrug transporter n=1 Tax=Sphaerosporella brunnea TaxID=1250544 RepID=A0A5J5EYU7_9PEZI|nr:MFS multidrug transporter [Sphaerosporella brunnea]